VLKLGGTVVTVRKREGCMPNVEQESPIDPDRSTGKKGKPWFLPNRSGPGWHPGSWQGGLSIVLIVAAIVTVVVLFRTGVL
jgi:hypothetical protein